MTTYTRAHVETFLVSRTSKLLTFVGKDGTTVNGTNSDLNDAIGSAIRKLDGTVSNPVLVADADVQTVASADFDALVDIAELRLLYSIRGNLTLTDVSAGPFSEKYSDVGDYLDDQIKALEDKVEAEHGIGGAEMEVGVITRKIASQADETEY